MPMLSLKRFELPEPTHYDEVPQIRPCMFAFAEIKEDLVRALHWPVLCRDFLNDTLIKKAKEKKDKLYVYKYRYSGTGLDTERCVLLITNWCGLKGNEKVIQEIEANLGISPSEFYHLGENTVCVVGDKWWMENTVKFSWYTTVLRGLSYPLNIQSLADIPVEGWMEEEFSRFVTLWKKFKDMPKLGVAGVSYEILKYNDWEYVHDFNGWKSQLTLPKFTRYGAYLNGEA